MPPIEIDKDCRVSLEGNAKAKSHKGACSIERANDTCLSALFIS
jgi:hypothetical protein